MKRTIFNMVVLVFGVTLVSHGIHNNLWILNAIGGGFLGLFASRVMK